MQSKLKETKAECQLSWILKKKDIRRAYVS